MKVHVIARSIAALASLALMASVGGVSAADASAKEQRGQLSEKDFMFVQEAAQGGLMEVQLGELAKQKAASPAVRSFGERMVTDHSKANQELQQIVASKAGQVPTSLSRHHNAEIERLQKDSGKDFDKAYAKLMLRDHKKDVKDFQDAAKDLTDPELRAFAKKTLPILEEHLRMVKELEASVGKSS
jgi:putative membrane protein